MRGARREERGALPATPRGARRRVRGAASGRLAAWGGLRRGAGRAGCDGGLGFGERRSAGAVMGHGLLDQGQARGAGWAYGLNLGWAPSWQGLFLSRASWCRCRETPYSTRPTRSSTLSIASCSPCPPLPAALLVHLYYASRHLLPLSVRARVRVCRSSPTASTADDAAAGPPGPRNMPHPQSAPPLSRAWLSHTS